MQELKFAVFGAGFWSNYQIAGWRELEGVRPVAICDPNLEKARVTAEKFAIPKAYANAEDVMDHESLDFIDIIADVESHLPLTKLAFENGLDVVCQKPMAPSFEECQYLVELGKRCGQRFFVNENFRWQAPVRRVKALLDAAVAGTPFKARVTFCSAFPVFDNQPFLKELKRFILTDVGTHILDICRYLFGEADYLTCHTKRVNQEIMGEDVANVFMEMNNGMHCYAEMSYASKLEHQVFPQTLLLIECDQGAIELTRGLKIKVTNGQGTIEEEVIPKTYHWADPAYMLIHSSIVDTHRNILNGLQGGLAETTAEDNLETLRLVWASYWSAEHKQTVRIDKFHGYE